MKTQVKELQVLIKEKQISPEEASRFIGCSAVTVYRWLWHESTPTIPYQRKIKEGIRKIKAEYPDEKEQSVPPSSDLMSIYEVVKEARSILLRIKPKLTMAEKDKLLDLESISLKEHLAALRVLNKKYG